MKNVYIFLAVFGIVSCSDSSEKRTLNKDLERHNLLLGLSISEVEDRLNSNIEFIKESDEGDKYIFDIENSMYYKYSDMPRCICLVDDVVIAYTIFYKEHSDEGCFQLLNMILRSCNRSKIETLEGFTSLKWSYNEVFYELSTTNSLNRRVVFHCGSKKM